jgi:glucose/mannose-6-phosphate isomerase
VIDLDDAAACASVDEHAFGALVESFPRQVAEAEQLAAGLTVPASPPRAVLAAGMGGSGAAGDLVQAVCLLDSSFPVVVLRGYRVPAWVDADTLVVAFSYSGDTEETVAVFDEARRRGARLLVVSSGGLLGDRATRDGTPWVRVPRGLPPRTALPSLLIPVLVVLERCGAIPPRAVDRGEAVSVLSALGAQLGPTVSCRENPAKELAQWAGDRRLAIYGSETTAAVAYRWSTQIEENAKTLALWGTLPEMNHNAIEAWGADGVDAWAVVLLRDAGEHPRVARGAGLTRAIVEARLPTREIWAQGRGPLARLLSLTLFGDWVSYYLAIRKGVDPRTVATLEGFKRALARPDASGPPAAPAA